MRLIEEAQRQGKERLKLVMQTICATGIRVSELAFITAEAVKAGRAEVSCKNKKRIVFLPEKLRRIFEGVYEKTPDCGRPCLYHQRKTSLKPKQYMGGNEKALRKGRR